MFDDGRKCGCGWILFIFNITKQTFSKLTILKMMKNGKITVKKAYSKYLQVNKKKRTNQTKPELLNETESNSNLIQIEFKFQFKSILPGFFLLFFPLFFSQ